jgi:hypothetical protein
MKNHLFKALVAVGALVAVPQIHAWTYSFTNHTNKRIAIGMRYQTTSNLEQRVIPPHQRRQFKPGEENPDTRHVDIGGGKVGYIVDQFFYMIDPQFSNWFKANGNAFNPGNINNAPWKALSLTWVPSDKYNIAVELAEAVGNFTETAAKTAAKAGAAYATGGASEIAEGATDAVKKAASKLNQKTEAVKELAAADYSLGTFFSSIGKMIGYTMAKNRHIDIVEDENGAVKFLTMLSE